MKRTGSFLGIPYDWRRPTWTRIKERMWNGRTSMFWRWRLSGQENVAFACRKIHKSCSIATICFLHSDEPLPHGLPQMAAWDKAQAPI